MVAIAKEQGYVETIFQRRRYIRAWERNQHPPSASGAPTPDSGSAADLIKIAMVRSTSGYATSVSQSHDPAGAR
jgi:DNA polymerase-1